MCLIVDASLAHLVLAQPKHPDALPVTKWLTKGGRIVYGGENGRELRRCGQDVIARLTELNRAGRATNIDQTKPGEVDSETKRVKAQCKSNDAHVVALARVSGARLLATDDGKLHSDFKNRDLIAEPRGAIYKDASHAHLLKAVDCP